MELDLGVYILLAGTMAWMLLEVFLFQSKGRHTVQFRHFLTRADDSWGVTCLVTGQYEPGERLPRNSYGQSDDGPDSEAIFLIDSVIDQESGLPVELTPAEEDEIEEAGCQLFERTHARD